MTRADCTGARIKRGCCSGEEASWAVLNDELVREIRQIRRDYRLGARSIAELMEERKGKPFSEYTIQDVLDGKTWRHVK